MRITGFIVLIACTAFFSNCNIVQHNVHKNFTYYKEDQCPASCINPRIDGLYELQNNHQNLIDEFFYFYNDGKFLYGKTNWGHYVIRNDSLLVQYFYFDGGSGFYYRNTIEMIGRISNDSIFIYKEKCDWCERRIGGFKDGEVSSSPPRIYTFRKSDQKPDSTKSFYYDKKWYNIGLTKK